MLMLKAELEFYSRTQTGLELVCKLDLSNVIPNPTVQKVERFRSALASSNPTYVIVCSFKTASDINPDELPF